MKLSRLIYLLFLTSLLMRFSVFGTLPLFWWNSSDPSESNFGDALSPIIVERILQKKISHSDLSTSNKALFAAGSILHFARNDDVIWGSGFRENPLEENRFQHIDIRAVRGPLTRNFLLQMGIPCPEVYGDPAVLVDVLFPEYQKSEKPLYDYIIIPNRGEIDGFTSYKNVVLTSEPIEVIIKKILSSRLVIASSLHGIIVAEAFGIPARLLKMSWIESLLKYEDYYYSTGRPHFRYATSVQEALEMGGEDPAVIDKNLLLNSFPYDQFHTNNR